MNMLSRLRNLPPRLTVALALLLGVGGHALAATKTWDAGGADGNWTTGGNWDANTAPVGGDSLIFGGTLRLNNTNNFPAGTGFGGITFNTPAGAFSLNGSSINLDGNITDNQPILTEAINLPLVLTGNRDVNVGFNGSLTMGGAISGGFGLSKSGVGLLTLSGANSYNGSTLVNAGTLSISSDGNLGAAPAAATPGSLVLSNGTLRSTASFTLNANRGIALGPTSGSGAVTILVPVANALTYGGVMANNGGSGGLNKAGFGTLVLGGANTYTGPTTVKNGTLTLDFNQAGSPANNILASTSPLVLGGENSGIGTTNHSTLLMNGGAGANSQTFNGTTIDLGSQVIRANSGAGGTATLNLGALNPLRYGDVTFVPSALTGGAGNITTTTTNVNGILGGWAYIGDGTLLNGMTLATNWASVDGSGNIVNYNNHVVYQSGWGKIRGNVTAADNLLIDDSSGVSSTVILDEEGAGTLTDINTINFRRSTPPAPTLGWTLRIGSNNVLRLGKYGSIFKSDTSTHPVVVGFGDGGTRAIAGAQDQGGILTAGGADNTPGVIVFNFNQGNQGDPNHQMVMAKITDTGTGQVTVVKAGSGPLNLGGHNTHSGGTYMIQGRVQAGGGFVGTINPDAYGSGPIYVLPGCYLYLNPAPPGGTIATLTNDLYLAGNGTQTEALGSIRFQNAGWEIASTVTLIGDATIGGNNGRPGITGRITGPFTLTMGSGATVVGVVRYANPNNDWTGGTLMQSRNTGANAVENGASEIIPHGFDKGNVTMFGLAGGTITWNLNGFNETVNGLSTSNNGASCIIVNNGTQPSTLSIGENDQSGTFAGGINDGTATIALTKIGGGTETLTAANSFTGDTTVNGGTLALAGAGTIASQNIFANGATFDVSGMAAEFVAAGPLRANNGTLVVNAVNASATAFNVTNSGLTVTLNPAEINFATPSLTTGGPTNRINITSVVNISGYPTEPITMIDYTGNIGGAGFNFGLGTVPSPVTVGYVSNDVVNTRIVVVLLNGPKPVTWRGTSGPDWDEGLTENWLEFKGTPNEAPASFFTADIAFFDDTGETNNVNLTTALLPGGVNVNNSAKDYRFYGSGSLGGLGSLTKQGTGSLTLANTGLSEFRGGLNVEAGSVIFATDNAIGGGVIIASGATVQVGTNGDTGSLPGGAVENEGSLIFNRGSTAYTVPNPIGGNGSLSKNDTAVLTLNGVNSSLTGAVAVVAGTLRTTTGSALGTEDGTTTISSGATLDISGQNLVSEPIIVSGVGMGGLGAIINTGADQQNALGDVTLTGHTTFGGRFRYDIRGGAATLSTGGQPFNLTKIGTNQFSLVGVAVDAALANINVGNGSTFAVETTTSGLGNSASTLTISNGATLQFFNSEVAFDKVFVLTGNNTTNTVNNASGNNTMAGAVTITGNTIFNVGGTSLTLNGAVGGAGTLRKTGTGLLTLNGNNTYAGGTTNTAGTLILNGSNTGGGTLTNLAGSSFGGRGTHTGPVQLAANATLLPGGNGVVGTLGTGPLTLTSPRVVFELGINDINNATANDHVTVTGNLTLQGVTTNTILTGPVGSLTNNQIITLFQYTGTLTGGTNNLLLIAPAGYEFVFLNPTDTPGAIPIKVIIAPAILTGRGHVAGSQTLWDIQTTTNWVDNGVLSDFLNLDGTIFDDTATTTTVNLTTNLSPSSITMNNNALNYTFTGSGKLSGSMRLDLQGGGLLTIANSGSNEFSGAVNVNNGTLQVGNGGAGGNLGTGVITNQGNLIFHRSGALTVSNIHGNGSVSNVGSGVVTLGGANTYDGTLTVNQGTVRAGSATALGSVLGGTLVANGATLEVGGQVLNLEAVTVRGAGVGGGGAIINTGADQINALGNVTLEGHTTFGGPGRWDIRGGAAALSTGGFAL